jgi:hypothetical protein
MSGTSTLTVIIGDSNDNKMQPGQKDIMVYNYMVRFKLDTPLSVYELALKIKNPNLKGLGHQMQCCGTGTGTGTGTVGTVTF